MWAGTTPEQRLRTRFFANVSPEPNTGCWLWDGRHNPKGYGLIQDEHGRQRGAHRISWALHFGPITNGLHVCHHCDQPTCVNPKHLFLGTNADNWADVVRKGRHYLKRNPGLVRRGSRSAYHKLTESDVRAVRQLLSEGFAQSRIAERFRVNQKTISLIKRGVTWRHVLDAEDR